MFLVSCDFAGSVIKKIIDLESWSLHTVENFIQKMTIDKVLNAWIRFDVTKIWILDKAQRICKTGELFGPAYIYIFFLNYSLPFTQNSLESIRCA